MGFLLNPFILPNPSTPGILRVGVMGDSISAYIIGSNTKHPSAYPTAITKANPCQVTLNGHGFATGDQVYPSSILGMTELNGNVYTATAIDANNFTINVDSTSFGTFTAATGQFFAIANASYGTAGRGYLNQAQIISGQRLHLFEQAACGIPSERTGAMLARAPQCLLPALGLNVGVFMGGTNDFTSGDPASGVITNALGVIDYYNNTLGIPCILGTVPPRDADLPAYKVQRGIYNAWVRTQASATVFIWDYENDVSTSPGSFNWKSGYSDDGVHPNNLGAYWMGKTLAAVIIANFGRGAWSIDAGNKIINPNFAGTGGTASGSMFSGTTQAAANWSFTGLGTVNNTYRTLSKGASGEQIIDYNFPSGLTAQEGCYAFQAITAANLTPDGWCRAEGLIKISNYTGTAPLTRLGISLLSNTGLLVMDNDVISGTPSSPFAVAEWVTYCGTDYLHFRTLPFKNAAAFTSLTLRIYSAFDCRSASAAMRVSLFSAQVYQVDYPYAAVSATQITSGDGTDVSWSDTTLATWSA